MGAVGAIARVEEHRGGSEVTRALAEHVGRLAITFAEMQLGLRPVSSLDDIASPAARRRMRRLVQLAARGSDGRRGASRCAPVRVLQVRAQHPSAGALEASVTVEWDGRARAIAVRLEQEVDHWLVVDLALPEHGLLPAVTTASRLGHVPVDEHGVRRSSFIPGREDEDADW
jgi:hypothetical protein